MPAEYRHDIALGIILCLVTCGLYNLYWNYRQFQAMNHLLEREEFVFWKWLVLSIITCGIYHIYYEYKMGAELLPILRNHGIEVSPNLATIGLALSIFGLTIVADAVYQHEFNKLC